MTLEADLILRATLREQICRKQEKLFMIRRLLSRNEYECSTLRNRHKEVDRRIFEQTIGISKVAIPIRSVHAQPKPAKLDDRFVAGLSEAMAQKLANRLKQRLADIAQREAERSISFHATAETTCEMAFDDIEDLKHLE